MQEHCIFLFAGIVDPDLRVEALNLYQQWEALRARLHASTVGDVYNLLQTTIGYKKRVLDAILTSGAWKGSIGAGFSDHVIREAEYFASKLRGETMSQCDEARFWNEISGDHACFASALLDPIFEGDLAKKARSTCDKIHGLNERGCSQTFIDLSLNAAKELDAFNRTAQAGSIAGTVQSIIHPALLSHVIREGERSIQTMQHFRR